MIEEIFWVVYEEEKKTIQLKGVSVQKNDKLENELASIAMKTIYR